MPDALLPFRSVRSPSLFQLGVCVSDEAIRGKKAKECKSGVVNLDFTIF